jgi:hypothetical protein
MKEYEFDVSMTPAARNTLRPGEALVLDWHRMAVCCAGAGEASLYAMNEDRARKRKGLVRLKGEEPVYAARAISPNSRPQGRPRRQKDPRLPPVRLRPAGRLRPARRDGVSPGGSGPLGTADHGAPGREFGEIV